MVSSVIQTLLAGRTVRVAHLVEFEFCTQVRRLWNGHYILTTSDSKEWFPLRKLGKIEGLDSNSDLSASEMRFSVSGVDSRFLQIAITEDRSEYVNQLVRVWLQFFDEDWAILNAPVAHATGLMDGVEVTCVESDGAWHRVIGINAQNLFAGRGLPPYSSYTARDQQLRVPGDRGLEPVTETVETIIPQPW